MGQNIRDFKSWQKLNEESFLSWAGGLFTGTETTPETPKKSEKEKEEKSKEEKSTLDKVVGAVGTIAGSVASAIGLSGDDSDEKSKTDKKSPSFKKFGNKIPAEYVAELEAAMDRHGITNEFSRKAILGVVSKESPNLDSEHDYSKTSNERIREVFGERVAALSDTDLTKLKENPTKFWDRVYGPDDPTGRGSKYGNSQPGDGEKYRGRGFNGITFKSNYKNLQAVYDKIGKIGAKKNIDIVEDPELLEDPEIAAEFAILYYIDSFNRTGRDVNNYKDLESAVTDYVRATAGWGSDITRGVKAQGFTKALDYAQSIA